MKALLIGLFLLFFTAIAYSYTIDVTLTWSLTGNYHIQDGSLIEVIMFRTGQGHNPPSGVGNNFDVIDYYDGVPSYDAFSVVPNNHHLVLTGNVAQSSSNYFFKTNFVILDNYNRIYFRIFSEPLTEDDYITYSYWGLTAAINRPGGKQPITIVMNNFVGVTNYNQFGQGIAPFEVIPEPPIARLVLYGFLVILLVKVFKNKYLIYRHFIV